MCLILFALNPNPRHRLVVAANRDEFHERPSASAAFWRQHPALLAGRDLRAGGTWLGVTRRGRFAAVTNLREPTPNPLPPGSRGQVTLDFLLDDAPATTWLRQLAARRHEFRGFNLLVGDLREGSLHYFASREGKSRQLEDGVYGLSNQLLDCDWPKVGSGREELRRLVEGPVAPEQLLELLKQRDTSRATGPDTVCSDRFILGESYGTVASTALVADRDGRVQFVERRFSSRGKVAEEAGFRFKVEA